MARLYLSLVKPGGDPKMPLAGRDCVTAACVSCGRDHDAIWTIERVLADTFGHFPVFRINGEMEVVDGSLPHKVEVLPRDARPVDPTKAAAVWHDTSGSHTFG